MKTAAGSPRRLAIASSSRVGFLTAPSAWSIRTRTSDISTLSPSDELLRGEEVDQRRGAGASHVGDDLALGARGTGIGGGHGGTGGREADLAGVDAEVTQRPRLER